MMASSYIQTKNSRILSIAATPYFADRGCHIRILHELNALDKQGHEIHLCTYGLGYNPPVSRVQLHRSFIFKNYKKLSPGFSKVKPLLNIFLLLKSLKVFKKVRPDTVIAFQHEAWAIAVIIKLFSRRKFELIFDCQSSVIDEIKAEHPNRVFWNFFCWVLRLVERPLVSFPKTILCSSINSLNYLKKNHPNLSSRLLLHPDFVEYGVFRGHNTAGKNTIREELKVPKLNRVVIYSGSMSKTKGVENLVDELPSFFEIHPNTTFIFLGYGDLLSEFKNKMKSFIEKKQVVFLNQVNYFDLYRYLEAADFAIDPKLEGSESSAKLLHYLALDLPIFCYKTKFNEETAGKRALFIDSFKDVARYFSNDLRLERHI